MRKILVADSQRSICDALERTLRSEFSVRSCRDGQTALELLSSFQPDILVIDLSLPVVDGLQVISTVRLAEMDIRILATAINDSVYIRKSLQQMRVDHMCLKPCHIDSFLCSIRQLVLHSDSAQLVPESEADHILIKLGFRMGYGMYKNTHTAIMMKYYGSTGTLMKELYPAIADSIRGSVSQVEKSIRDAIHRAYKSGNTAVWKLIFGDAVEHQCPSNELFITRIAHILQSREQIRTANEADALQQKNA